MNNEETSKEHKKSLLCLYVIAHSAKLRVLDGKLVGGDRLVRFQVSSLLRKIEKIQNMMYHCSQLAIAIRGEQWLDTK